MSTLLPQRDHESGQHRARSPVPNLSEQHRHERLGGQGQAGLVRPRLHQSVHRPQTQVSWKVFFPYRCLEYVRFTN